MAKIKEVGVPQNLLEKAVGELENLYSLDQCDHSVGICYCELENLILRLKDCLKPPTPNPNKAGKP